MALKTSYTPGQFSWIDMVAHDANEAKRFYSELFGWNPVDQDTQGGPPYTQFELEGKSVAGLGQMSDEMKAQGIPPMWNSYVSVADVQATVEKVTDSGGKVTMPPMPILHDGTMAYVQDPTGGNLGLWQPNQHHGAERIYEPNCLCWNELATREIETAKDFYCALFGWEMVDFPGNPTKYYVIHHEGAQIGGLLQMNEQWPENVPAHWSVYFSTADIHATVAKLKELQGKVHAEPFDTQVGPISVVNDSQGTHFYLIQLLDQAA